MEGMFDFVGWIIIIFGILQIILFFKIWGMTNRIASIDDKLKNQRDDYEFFMLAGEKEKAFLLIRDSLIKHLIDLKPRTYNTDRFIKLANENLPEYIKKMKATGFEIPEYLLSAEAFLEYQTETIHPNE